MTTPPTSFLKLGHRSFVDRIVPGGRIHSLILGGPERVHHPPLGRLSYCSPCSQQQPGHCCHRAVCGCGSSPGSDPESLLKRGSCAVSQTSPSHAFGQSYLVVPPSQCYQQCPGFVELLIYRTTDGTWCLEFKKPHDNLAGRK